MGRALKPSLWRTARVLANLRRLRVLHAVSRSGRISVSAVAAQCRLSLPNATQMLRALQARGLLRAQRVGGWVFYSPDPDPAVAFARPLAAALRTALSADAQTRRDILRQLTAYTHHRRIAIVRAVSAGSQTKPAVARACRISAQALTRHLDKLQRRGVIGERDEHLLLLTPASPLAATLLTLALTETTEA